jgi:hypothetical protein
MTDNPLVALRHDWLDFLDPGGLRRWAGWSALDEVLVKELADNAADAAATSASVSLQDGVLIVENDGPDLPIAPEELFTIKRPLTSSKVWRCAGRGALGNGARVVAGIVAAHGGTITVTSAGKRTTLGFDDHGTTLVVDRSDVGATIGTRIEITPMPRLPVRPAVVEDYLRLSCPGQAYRGRPNPHWFDADGVLALFRGLPETTVRSLASQFNVPTGTLADDDRVLGTLQRGDAEAILHNLRAAPLKCPALSQIGEHQFSSHYAIAKGDVRIGHAEMPAIVEVWSDAEAASTKDAEVNVNGLIMNRTMALMHLDGHWASRRVNLNLGSTSVRIDGLSAATWHLVIGVTCPYVPILSAGKAPDLSAFTGLIERAAKASLRASRAAIRGATCRGISIKEAAGRIMEEAYLEASAGGTLPANARQIMYAARGAILGMTGKESFDDKYFTQTLLPDYLSENPETTKGWDVVYDARGTFAEPHSGRQVALGTLGVRKYLGDTPDKVGRIEPGIAQLVQAHGSGCDGPGARVLGVGGGGKVGGQALGEGEGLEGGGGGVAGTILQRSAHPQRPEFVEAGMEDAEGGVVVAQRNDDLAVRNHHFVKPYEQTMLCHSGCRDHATDTGGGRPHSLSGST